MIAFSFIYCGRWSSVSARSMLNRRYLLQVSRKVRNDGYILDSVIRFQQSSFFRIAMGSKEKLGSFPDARFQLGYRSNGDWRRIKLFDFLFD